jgi:hypothetical protein
MQKTKRRRFKSSAFLILKRQYRRAFSRLFVRKAAQMLVFSCHPEMLLRGICFLHHRATEQKKQIPHPMKLGSE